MSEAATAYTLGNGVELHAKHPDSFWIPSDADKTALAPGDFAKLMFIVTDDEVAAERMWVEVVAVGPDEGYRISKRQLAGTLANDPMFVDDLEHGDVVLFHLDNVINIAEPDDGGAA